jgi:hypothetical protein
LFGVVMGGCLSQREPALVDEDAQSEWLTMALAEHENPCVIGDVKGFKSAKHDCG